MTCQENRNLKRELPFIARMFSKGTLPFLLLPMFFLSASSWAQMSTNLDALPGGRDSSETQDAPPSNRSSNSSSGFSNTYNSNYGGNSSGSGIVSSQQAKQAANNLGISSNYSGSAFPQRQDNSQEAGENSPPAPPLQGRSSTSSHQNRQAQQAADNLGISSNYTGAAFPQRQQSSQTTGASAPSRQSRGNTARNPSTTPPYENGIVPVKRTGTTVIPPIPSSPPPLILAPPFPAVTLHPPVDPEPVLPVKGAVSDTRPLANSLEGIRIEFAPLKEGMDQETIEAVKRFGTHMAHNPNIRLLLEGFSGPQDDDPSLPRRLALQRLLDIRSLLMRAGVASTRIYPKTIGVPRANTHETNGPADRVDIYPEENPNELIPEDDAIARAQKDYPSKS